MVAWLRADAPDVVLFKGIDYDVVPQVIAALDRARTRIGFVIGKPVPKMPLVPKLLVALVVIRACVAFAFAIGK